MADNLQGEIAVTAATTPDDPLPHAGQHRASSGKAPGQSGQGPASYLPVHILLCPIRRMLIFQLIKNSFDLQLNLRYSFLFILFVYDKKYILKDIITQLIEKFLYFYFHSFIVK